MVDGTPTPEAVEAVARAITHALDSDWVDWNEAFNHDAALDIAADAIAAYLTHQQQHAPDTLHTRIKPIRSYPVTIQPDTLSADLAAILGYSRITGVFITVDLIEGYEAVAHVHDFVSVFKGDRSSSIPEAVAAPRRQIKGVEG